MGMPHPGPGQRKPSVLRLDPEPSLMMCPATGGTRAAGTQGLACSVTPKLLLDALCCMDRASRLCGSQHWALTSLAVPHRQMPRHGVQGTLGLELMQQTQGDLDAVIVPVSGGGMLAGVATAVKGCKPGAVVLAAEPRGKWGPLSLRSRPCVPDRVGKRKGLRRPVQVMSTLGGCRCPQCSGVGNPLSRGLTDTGKKVVLRLLPNVPG